MSGPGADVRTGERFGLMKFGSRIDLFLPPRATLRCAVGDQGPERRNGRGDMVSAGRPMIGHGEDVGNGDDERDGRDASRA